MNREEINSKNIQRFTLFSAEFIIALFLALSLLSLAFAIHIAFINKGHSFDNKVFEFLSGFISPAKTNFLLFITFLGNHKFLFPVNVLLLVYFLIRKNRRFSVRISALLMTSLALLFLLKLSIQRPRPDDPLLQSVKGFSFPSGHALMSVIFYGLLIYIVWKEVSNKWMRRVVISFMIILIILISYSRIYLRLHYASDVLAGLSVGFIWLVFSLWIIKRIETGLRKRKERRNEIANI